MNSKKRWGKGRPAMLLPNDINFVVVDEAHHAVADSYKDVLAHVGSFEPNGPLTVGFTATPMRGDGLKRCQLRETTAHGNPWTGTRPR